VVAVVIEHPSISRGRRPPMPSMRNACAVCRSVRTRSSGFQVLAAVLLASLTLLLHSASFQLESIFDSESILEAPMPSESGAQAVHRGFACMGCTARRRGDAGDSTFFNDYQSAASHYSRSSLCNKSMRGIKLVTVQLNPRPQHIGDGVTRAGGAPGVWRPHCATRPIPPRR
jgi:hypothetical protein